MSFRLLAMCAAFATLVACALPEPCPEGMRRRGDRWCVSVEEGGANAVMEDPQKPELAPDSASTSLRGSDVEGMEVDVGSEEASVSPGGLDADMDGSAAGDIDAYVDGGVAQAKADPLQDAKASDADDSAAWVGGDGPVDAGAGLDANAAGAGLDANADASAAEGGPPDGAFGDAQLGDTSCALAPDLVAWRALADDGGRTACESTSPNCAVRACPAEACRDEAATPSSCNACAGDAGTWPNHEVILCWLGDSATRADRYSYGGPFWHAMQDSWPAIADIEFKFANLDPCPVGVMGVVPINAQPDFRGGVPWLDYQTPNASYAPIELGTVRQDFDYALVPHLLGHVLGFDHGVSRRDCVPAGGDAVDYDSIMFETNDCRRRTMLSRWDIVRAREKFGQRADNVVATGAALFARKLSTGDIYRLDRDDIDRADFTKWVKFSGPVGQLIAIGTQLYAMNRDLSAILEYRASEGSWRRIGYEALGIMACGQDLCATLPGGELVRYRNAVWTRISGAARKFVATSGAIYRLTVKTLEAQVYSEGDSAWRTIRSNVGTIHATGSTFFAGDRTTGYVSRFNGTGFDENISWWVRQFEQVGADLYHLDWQRDGIWRAQPDHWDQISGKVDWIYSGPDAVYATDSTSKDIYRYGNGAWVRIGQP